MTTLAKIEANQRNGERSTGPRSIEGKAVVARNAVKHGIFAAVPVIPGESADLWDAHRAGVVDALAPVGLLEVNLAERAALLLWRLQRLARYEVSAIDPGGEEYDAPPLPPPEDRFADPPEEQMTRDEQLRDIRRELRNACEELAAFVPARNYFLSPPRPGDTVPVSVATTILETAFSRAEVAENLESDPPEFTSKPFLGKIGLASKKPDKVAWTPDRIDRGIAAYASYTDEPPAKFRAGVRAEVEESAEELAWKVRRLEREAKAVARLLDTSGVRQRPPGLIPSSGQDERVAKYERHLHNLLTSTLHELERLQARREGGAVPPPAVADVNITIDTGVV